MAGEPGEVLVCESRRAAMVCVGSRPRWHAEESVLGPAATTLAQRAECPVAIIRSRNDGTARTDGVVSVVLTDETGNEELVHLAMHEARLRHATVRQIDRRTDSWIRRYPDVPVETVADGVGHRYSSGRAAEEADVGLAVVGGRDADRLATLTMPNPHPITGYPDCSLLLVRTGGSESPAGPAEGPSTDQAVNSSTSSMGRRGVGGSASATLGARPIRTST